MSPAVRTVMPVVQEPSSAHSRVSVTITATDDGRAETHVKPEACTRTDAIVEPPGSTVAAAGEIEAMSAAAGSGAATTVVVETTSTAASTRHARVRLTS